MQIEQKRWTEEKKWETLSKTLEQPAQLVLVFGERLRLESGSYYAEIKKMYPEADIVICSSAGEIIGTNVTTDTIVLSAIHFDKARINIVTSDVKKGESFSAAAALAKQLPQEDLVHTLVFSDGLIVNGTELVNGLLSELPDTVSVTGGLVGDSDRFKATVLGLNSEPQPDQIVLIGLYGPLQVSYGSVGGWDDFGPSRKVTKSKENVVFELDGKPALELYKNYLGDKAKDLPGSGLLFPLSLDTPDGEVVRTLLAIDETEQSLTFAGSIPEGTTVKLMKANFERLIDGASGAASMNVRKFGSDGSELALLISCIGRRLVLGARIEEEVEAVSQVLGASVPMIGLYSYGEIAPMTPTERQCRLHNQTMTITTFKEM